MMLMWLRGIVRVLKNHFPIVRRRTYDDMAKAAAKLQVQLLSSGYEVRKWKTLAHRAAGLLTDRRQQWREAVLEAERHLRDIAQMKKELDKATEQLVDREETIRALEGKVSTYLCEMRRAQSAKPILDQQTCHLRAWMGALAADTRVPEDYRRQMAVDYGNLSRFLTAHVNHSPGANHWFDPDPKNAGHLQAEIPKLSGTCQMSEVAV